MKNDSGFSLIEAMVALAVLAVLTSVAAPSFRSFLLDSKRAAAVNDLLADMTFARSESARRGRVVSVCSNTSGDSCAAAGNWANGWLVFEDSNSNGVRDATPVAEEIIRRARAQDDTFGVQSSRASYRFKPFNARVVAGSVTFCDPRDAGATVVSHSRAVIVATSGRARVDNKRADGTALPCS